MTLITDRRVLRSRRLFADALLDLIVEKGYEEITIQEIADRADLNRATFYLHYASKEELLLAGLAQRFDELVAAMAEVEHAGAPWDNIAYDLLLFRHVAEHDRLYKALFGARGLGLAMHQVIAYMASFIERDIRDVVPESEQGSIKIPVAAHFFAGALFALIKWWLDNDMPASPEEMAMLSNRLCSYGAVAALDPWIQVARQ